MSKLKQFIREAVQPELIASQEAVVDTVGTLSQFKASMESLYFFGDQLRQNGGAGSEHFHQLAAAVTEGTGLCLSTESIDDALTTLSAGIRHLDNQISLEAKKDEEDEDDESDKDEDEKKDDDKSDDEEDESEKDDDESDDKDDESEEDED